MEYFEMVAGRAYVLVQGLLFVTASATIMLGAHISLEADNLREEELASYKAKLKALVYTDLALILYLLFMP